MLRTIRRNTFFNKVIRNLLKINQTILKKIISKWRLSGNITLNIANKNITLYNQCDDGIIDALYYDYDNYVEKNDIELFIHKAQKSTTIIDIGANTGLYAIAAAIHQPAAQVYAFEPNPHNLKRLHKNIALNHLKNIQIIPQAVGNSLEAVSFNIPESDGISDTSSVLKEFSQSTYKGMLQWKTINVEQTTLDTLIETHHLKAVDLIKIDVEGYEVQVFEGGHQFFHHFNPMILCEIFLNTEKKIYFEKFLQDYDYYAYLILKQGVVYLGQNLIPNPEGLNYLFVRKKSTTPIIFFKSQENNLKELI